MPTEAELVQMIAADLDDPTAWQVYTDWLLEQGDPRGELVRLQVALADMDDEDPDYKPTEKAIGLLLHAHSSRWLAAVAGVRVRAVRWSMQRGVVGGIAGPPIMLGKYGEQILAAAPLLTEATIVLDRVHRDLAHLAGSPLLVQVRALAVVSSGLKCTGWSALAELPNVRALRLGGCTLATEDVEAVLAEPRVPKLESLTLAMCKLNKDALQPLARATCPLRRLELPAYHLGPWLGQTIGARFHGLTYLRIPGNELGRAGLDAMLAALTHVEHLDLRGCALAVADVAALLRTPMPALRVLKLGGNTLGDAGAELVAAWSGAGTLARLHLGDAGITAAGAVALAGSPHLANLVALNLSGSRFDEATEAALVASPHLARARIYTGNRILGRKPKPAKKSAARRP